MIRKIADSKKETILYFLAKAVSGICGFVLISILSFILVPSEYGEYSLIFGVVSIIVSVMIGWLSSSSLRYYHLYKDRKNVFYSNIFAQWVMSSSISTLGLVLMSRLFDNVGIQKHILPVILVFLSNGFIELFSAISRAARKTTDFLISIVIQYGLCIGFIVLFSKIWMGIDGVFVSYALSQAFAALYLAMRMGVVKYIKLKYASKDVFKQFLKYGIPMVGVWATSWILSYSDRYIIKIFGGSEQVGIYDVGYRVAENSINIIITSLSMAMFPIIINHYHDCGFKKAKNTHKTFMEYYYAMVFPAVFGLMSIRNLLFGSILNEKYSSGAIIIDIIAISSLFYGFNQMMYKIWQLKERANTVFIFNIISVIINIVLNLVFIPKYGYVAASVTTLVSNCLISFILLLIAYKSFQYTINITSIIKPMIASAIMYILILLVQRLISNVLLSLIASVLLGVVIYGVCLYMFNIGNIRRQLGEK